MIQIKLYFFLFRLKKIEESLIFLAFPFSLSRQQLNVWPIKVILGKVVMVISLFIKHDTELQFLVVPKNFSGGPVFCAPCSPVLNLDKPTNKVVRVISVNFFIHSIKIWGWFALLWLNNVLWW